MSKSINKILAVLSLALVFAASTGFAAGTLLPPTKTTTKTAPAPAPATSPAPAPAPAPAPTAPTGTITK